MADLVEKYVYEIGQHLPKTNRADIEAEIHSLIQDTLENRSQSEGRPVDEEMVVEVLKEFGPPAKMAESYLPARYLIGPKFFPSFVQVMRIIFAVILVLALIRLGVALGNTGFTWSNIQEELFGALASIGVNAISLFGSVVILFALMEWSLSKRIKVQTFERLDPRGLGGRVLEEWDPLRLLGDTQEERVQPAGVAVGIVFTILAIVIFNFYPQLIGISYYGKEWVQTPVLNDTFYGYMPLINVVWGLSILKDLFLLRMGVYTALTRYFSIGPNILNIIVAAIILRGSSILNPAFLWNLPSSEVFLRMLDVVVDIALVGVIIRSGWEIARTIFQLLGKKIPVFVIKDK
jgi:hypothetical protein